MNGGEALKEVHRQIEEILELGDIDEFEESQLLLCRGSLEFILRNRKERPRREDRPTILVIDDDEEYLRSLCEELSKSFEILACASAEQAMAELEQGRPIRGLVVDVFLPGQDGLSFLGDALSRFPIAGVPILVLSSSRDAGIESRAYEAGGLVMLQKPCEPQKVARILGSALARTEELEARTRKRLAQSLLASRQEPLPASNSSQFQFSPRERDVIALLSRGLQLKEIAAELELSPHTVNSHIRNIYEKCGVSNRVELMIKLK